MALMGVDGHILMASMLCDMIVPNIDTLYQTLAIAR